MPLVYGYTAREQGGTLEILASLCLLQWEAGEHAEPWFPPLGVWQGSGAGISSLQ